MSALLSDADDTLGQPAPRQPLTRALDAALDAAETALRRLAAEVRIGAPSYAASMLNLRAEARGAVERLFVALGNRARCDVLGLLQSLDGTLDADTLVGWADGLAAYGEALEAATPPRPMLAAGPPELLAGGVTTRADVAPSLVQRRPSRSVSFEPRPVDEDAELRAVAAMLGVA